MSQVLLQDRVVWVIGASGAIGNAIARLSAAAGAIVVASGRSADKLAALASHIQADGGRVHPRVVDVCRRADVDTTAEEIVARHGRIDGLVNSTSLSIFGDFLELSDEQWHQVLDTKLLGYVRSMRAVLPHMIRQSNGAIVNISGRGGRQPTPAHLPGGSANAGVNLISKGIADTYQKHGIRVNTVAPGPIQSDRFEKIRASNERVTGGALPRVSRLSDRARHITGAVVPVDGGGTATV